MTSSTELVLDKPFVKSCIVGGKNGGPLHKSGNVANDLVKTGALATSLAETPWMFVGPTSRCGLTRVSNWSTTLPAKSSNTIAISTIRSVFLGKPVVSVSKTQIKWSIVALSRFLYWKEKPHCSAIANMNVARRGLTPACSLQNLICSSLSSSSWSFWSCRNMRCLWSGVQPGWHIQDRHSVDPPVKSRELQDALFLTLRSLAPPTLLHPEVALMMAVVLVQFHWNECRS